MQSPNQSVYAVSPGVTLPDPVPPQPAVVETLDVLKQLLETQREQLAHARHHTAQTDHNARWKRFLEKWQTEFPHVGRDCKRVLPTMERIYLRMIRELTDRLSDEDDDLESEYILGEFLDKYGMRLNQLGTIIGQLTPIADATPAAADGTAST